MATSNNPPSRKLRLPSAALNTFAIPITRLPARSWFRLHQLIHSPVYFSLHSHHRFSHPDCPHPLSYLAENIDTCLFERFADEVYDGHNALPFSLWKSQGISQIRCPALRLCDLTNPQTLSALTVDLTSLMTDLITITQEWGLALQRHPAQFQGLRYASRFDGRDCVALFDRNHLKAEMTVVSSHPLHTVSAATDWLDAHNVHLY